MRTRTFVLVVIGFVVLVSIAFAMHREGGGGLARLLPSIHGGR